MVTARFAHAANPVLGSAAPVVENSRFVSVDKERIREFARRFKETGFRHWTAASPPSLSGLANEEKLAFLFVFNSVSFCYWGTPKWAVVHNGSLHLRGTWSMIAALTRAVDEGKPIFNPAYLRSMGKDEFGEILRGTAQIPLLEERSAILRELGEVTAREFGGNFANVVARARGDAISLLLLTVEAVPSFDDSSLLEGKQVHFHKRAQLLVSDIHAVFGGNGYGSLSRVEELTACADYILPMVLRHNGILVYDKNLAERVDDEVQIQDGSTEEIEIRANTIFAVELLRKELLGRFPGITSMQLNDYLWLAGAEVPENVRHHLTRTTAY